MPKSRDNVARRKPSSPAAQATSSRASVTLAQTRQELYSGPLPPPELLARYNEIVPDGANRIFAVFEEQAQHRMHLEKTVVESDVRRANWGLVAGLLVSLAAIAAGSFLIYTGHDAAGATIVGLDLVGLVSAFIYGTNSRKSERIEKVNTLARQNKK